MYLIVDKNNKVLAFKNKAVGFESKREALKVIKADNNLRLVWKPSHDDDTVLAPKEFDKILGINNLL